MEIKFPIEVKVRAGKPKTRIVSCEDGVFLLDVAAKAEDNKANIEIIKFFSRLAGERVKIVKGLRSKKKVIDIT